MKSRMPKRADFDNDVQFLLALWSWMDKEMAVVR